MTFTSLEVTPEIKRKIETREARLGIIGMGYVGLPLALLFSEERFDRAIFARVIRNDQCLCGFLVVQKTHGFLRCEKTFCPTRNLAVGHVA